MPTLINHRDEPSTDVSLLHRAREGHEEGWQRLVQIYGPLVYRWMIGCGVQNADAADIMQETLVSVSQALPKFDAARQDASFRRWMWTIARNKLRDRQRDQERAGGNTDLARSLDDAAVRQFAQQDLSVPPTNERSDRSLVRLRALDCLRDQFPDRAWKMFWETEIEGRKAADVAEDLGVSKWAVYKANARVLHKLRQELLGLE